MNQTHYKQRMNLAARVVIHFCDIMDGIILVGSTAYNPQCVTEKSDLDFVFVTKDCDIEEIIESEFVKDDELNSRLRHRYFDGYRFDNNIEGIGISIHILRKSVFESICSPQIRNLRLFINRPHKSSYNLFSFDGSVRLYRIIPTSKDDSLKVLNVPVFFIEGERCYVGVHADKLLSNPLVMHENGDSINRNIDNLWLGAVRHLQDQLFHCSYSEIDLSKQNIINSLSRKDKFSEESKNFVDTKTRESLTVLNKSKILK